MEKREERRESEIVYSRSVKAGKRIYYFDVRKARNEDLRSTNYSCTKRILHTSRKSCKMLLDTFKII